MRKWKQGEKRKGLPTNALGPPSSRAWQDGLTYRQGERKASIGLPWSGCSHRLGLRLSFLEASHLPTLKSTPKPLQETGKTINKKIGKWTEKKKWRLELQETVTSWWIIIPVSLISLLRCRSPTQTQSLTDTELIKLGLSVEYAAMWMIPLAQKKFNLTLVFSLLILPLTE